MERIYYPSRLRVLCFYIFVPLGFLCGFATWALVDALRGIPPPPFNWTLFIGLSLTLIVGNILTNGVLGKNLAIKITASAIAGPVQVGRAEPIYFNEIDYERTRKKKRIYSIRGDQIRFEKILFDPKDVAEIWRTVYQAEGKHHQ